MVKQLAIKPKMTDDETFCRTQSNVLNLYGINTTMEPFHTAGSVITLNTVELHWKCEHVFPKCLNHVINGIKRRRRCSSGGKLGLGEAGESWAWKCHEFMIQHADINPLTSLRPRHMSNFVFNLRWWRPKRSWTSFNLCFISVALSSIQVLIKSYLWLVLRKRSIVEKTNLIFNIQTKYHFSFCIDRKPSAVCWNPM